MRSTKYIFLLSIFSFISLEANENLPSTLPNKPILFRGGTIHPVSSEAFKGDLLIEGSVIKSLFKAPKSFPKEKVPSVQVVECKGLHLYPGMISANSVLGLTEIRAVRATRDMIEAGDINPNVRAEVAVNPDSELFPVTRSNGVLHALSVPQGNGLISGKSALMSLDGWTWEEMVIKSSVGMHMKWPLVPSPERGANKKQKEEIQKRKKAAISKLKKIKESFLRARAYHKAKQDKGRSDKIDLRWDSMGPVLKGDVPIYVHVNKLSGIRSAVNFAVEQNIRIVIVGGADAWRTIPLLKKHSVPVVISPVNALPSRRWEEYDTPMVNPLKLYQGGVQICIAGPGGSMDAPHERNLPYEAARAAAYGLPKDEALRSVTLYPANILGVGDRLGSLEIGKDATLIVCTNDPLEVTSNVEMAYIKGKPIGLSNKQTRLYEKYKVKYRQLREKNKG